MPEPLKWTLRIVGGGFDGAQHLAWLDDGEHPPPEEIVVGVCAAGSTCGTAACRREASHISFWTIDEPDAPTKAERYEKANEFIVRGDLADLNRRPMGVAEYVIGGLRDPQNFGERAREPIAALSGKIPTEVERADERELEPVPA